MQYNFDELTAQIKNKQLKLIGVGSSRKVYDLGDGNVVKVAKDTRGISQSSAEYQIYHSKKSDMFAEIIAVSDDYKFLVMPKAQKIKNITTVYKYYNVRNFVVLIKLDNLEEDIKNLGIGKGDLTRATSWGLIDGIPKIIDYGLTHSIFNKYYRLSLFRKKPRPIRL